MNAALQHRPGTRALPAVEAELNFLAPDSPHPVSYTFQPPEGVPWTTARTEPRRVAIHDGRHQAEFGVIGLDVTGFEAIHHRSVITDIAETPDDAWIRSTYCPESVQLLRRITGAEKVVIFDHTVRDSALGARDTPGLREPVRRVHNDQTPRAAARRVRDHLPVPEAEARLAGRFAIVNLWRPLATVEQLPLALCDARTIAPQDLVASDLVYRDKVGETWSLHYNANQRWFWFPQLRSDEALLLKIFDSLEDGTARLTAHTAFDHPATPLDAAPRRSIELRALLFWKREGAP